MSMKLYVGNLAFTTSNAELEKLFGEIGTIESAIVIEDCETGRSRGFGFVEMSLPEDAQRSIIQLDDNLVIKEKAELTERLKEFTVTTKSIYRKIDNAHKEIEKLNAKSAKRQKRFEVAMQKLEGLLK